MKAKIYKSGTVFMPITERLTTTPILASANLKGPYDLNTGASRVGLGATFYQE